MKNQANKRKSISKKTRFEVFKRDKFRCQFCGQSAPDVVLEIDHINPVSKGGNNSLINLITSCFECNRGKRNRRLDDDSELKKQKAQLEELQSRRNQLEMMAKWRKELSKLDDKFIEHCELIFQQCTGLLWSMNNYGKNGLLKLRKKYKDSEIFEVCEISMRQYYNFPKDEEDQIKDWNKAVNYIPKILNVREKQKNNPELKELYYCRGILRNKSSYMNEWQVLEYLKELREENYSLEDIKDAALECNNFNNFKTYFDL